MSLWPAGQPAIMRGSHPGPGDVTLVVEVTRTSAAKDRKLAPIYAACGIPVYWIVNVPERRLEVYESPIEGTYPAPKILGEADAAQLLIDGKVVGQISVADLLPLPGHP